MVAKAQNRHVFGVVIDSSNDEPLIGATVMPVGKGYGTVTDVDGKFSLNLDSSVRQIKVSYVGMESQTADAVFGQGMTIRLRSTENVLDEVIVVAYGTSTKGAFTGSASVVDASQLEDRLVTRRAVAECKLTARHRACGQDSRRRVNQRRHGPALCR